MTARRQPTTPGTPRPKPSPNTTPAVISANEFYTLEEAARRMRWKKHSVRQARRAGLETVIFGSRRYVSGQAVIDLMQKLAGQQNES